MPAGRNAPRLWPAEPVSVMSIVSSGRPAPPHRLVTSWPSSVPTVRLTLRTGRSIVTGWASRIAGWASSMNVWSSASSRPWSWPTLWMSVCPYGFSGTCRIGVMSRPDAFQCVDGLARVEALDVADHLLEGPEAEVGHELAHLGRR